MSTEILGFSRVKQSYSDFMIGPGTGYSEEMSRIKNFLSKNKLRLGTKEDFINYIKTNEEESKLVLKRFIKYPLAIKEIRGKNYIFVPHKGCIDRLGWLSIIGGTGSIITNGIIGLGATSYMKHKGLIDTTCYAFGVTKDGKIRVKDKFSFDVQMYEYEFAEGLVYKPPKKK